MPANEKGSGIALATLRERLERHFGARAGIDLDVRAQGARARVRLPLSTLVASPAIASDAPLSSSAGRPGALA